MQFKDFQQANATRLNDPAYAVCKDWSLLEWAGSLCGESGEIIKEVKKIRLGTAELTDATKIRIGKEIADVITYADIIATLLGLDTGTCVRDKFNEVSRRVGSGVMICSCHERGVYMTVDCADAEALDEGPYRRDIPGPYSDMSYSGPQVESRT